MAQISIPLIIMILQHSDNAPAILFLIVCPIMLNV